MTSREDLGRLACAAYCDMAGLPGAWDALSGREKAAWTWVAVAVRDRLTLGISHAYRPEDGPPPQGEESPMPSTTLHGGSEEPNITETDDAEAYTRAKAAGNVDVQWSGDGPAPDAEPEHVRVEREQREREALDAEKSAQQDQRDDGTGVEQPKLQTSRSTRAKR